MFETYDTSEGDLERKKSFSPAPHFMLGHSAATVFLFFSLAISLPVIILSLFSVFSSLRQSESETHRANNATARLAAQALSQRINDLRSQLISHEPAINLEVGNTDTTRMQGSLDTITKSNPDLAYVAVVSANGTITLQSPLKGAAVGASIAKEPWYREYLQSSDKMTISNAFRMKSPPYSYVALVTIPMKASGGKPDSILVGAIRLTSIQAWLDSIRLNEGSYLYVVDRQGRLVARPGLGVNQGPRSLTGLTPVDRVIKGQSGTGRFYNSETLRDEFSAYVAAPKIGWGIVAQQPVSSSLAASYKLAGRIILIAMLLVALSLAISALIAHLYRRNQGLYQQLSDSLTRERGIASALQESLLGQAPQTPLLDIGIRHVSATAGALVGGDFYDVIPLSNQRVAIIIGDVCGKGVTTAVQTAVVRGLIRGIIASTDSPGDLLSALNERMIALSSSYISSETFVTMIAAVFDASEGTFLYSQAGHPSPVLAKGRSAAALPQLQGPALGVIEGAYYEETVMKLGSTDSILMYTDGLLETRHEGEFFGEERIVRIFGHHSNLPPQSLVERLFRECVRFAKGKLSDDIAIMVLRKSELSLMPGVGIPPQPSHKSQRDLGRAFSMPSSN